MNMDEYGGARGEETRAVLRSCTMRFAQPTGLSLYIDLVQAGDVFYQLHALLATYATFAFHLNPFNVCSMPYRHGQKNHV